MQARAGGAWGSMGEWGDGGQGPAWVRGGLVVPRRIDKRLPRRERRGVQKSAGPASAPATEAAHGPGPLSGLSAPRARGQRTERVRHVAQQVPQQQPQVQDWAGVKVEAVLVERLDIQLQDRGYRLAGEGVRGLAGEGLPQPAASRVAARRRKIARKRNAQCAAAPSPSRTRSGAHRVSEALYEVPERGHPQRRVVELVVVLQLRGAGRFDMGKGCVVGRVIRGFGAYALLNS